MSSEDVHALIAHVGSVFDSLVVGIHDHYPVKLIYRSILRDVLRVLRTRLSVWNEKNARLRLPPELLASSFHYLSFRDKISVSHVSRSWRGAAIGFPGLWTDIDLPPVFGATSLLEMAVTRAAHIPIDLTFCNENKYFSVDWVIGYHLHRFRSIRLRTNFIDDEVFTNPAPALETLSLSAPSPSAPITISENFLGGTLGRLRQLELSGVTFPYDAPALATVTILSFQIPQASALPAHLFTLFPRLQSLSIRNVHSGIVGSLPDGPVPLSLAELYLEAGKGDGRDAVMLYVAWRTENIRRVTISADALHDITALVSDARHLAVNFIQDKKEASLTAVDATGHRRTLLLHSQLKPPDGLYSLVGVSRALERLESLLMTLPEFARLLGYDRHPTFPALKNLTLRIHERALVSPSSTWVNPNAIRDNPRPRLFRWHDLDVLSQAHLVLELKSFVLEVLCVDDAPLPAQADALDLLKSLRRYAVAGGMTSVCIRGFPEVAVRDIDLNSVPGLKIAFEAM